MVSAATRAPRSRPMAATLRSVVARAGKDQIFTINRMGQDLKQITKVGNRPGAELVEWAGGTPITRFGDLVIW